MGRLGLSINKKFVNQVLSLDDAKKLKDLGVDLSERAFTWRKQVQDWNRKDLNTGYILEHNLAPVVMGFETFDEIPTATATELFELLPMDFILEGNAWDLYLSCGPDPKGIYFIEYSDTPLGNPIISVNGESLLEVSYNAILELINLGVKLDGKER